MQLSVHFVVDNSTYRAHYAQAQMQMQMAVCNIYIYVYSMVRLLFVDVQRSQYTVQMNHFDATFWETLEKGSTRVYKSVPEYFEIRTP